MAKTDKPTGATITRKGNKFTFKWTIKDKDHGDGQELQYKLGSGDWKSLSVSKTAKEKVYELTLANFYPSSGKPKLAKIAFRIRGNRKNYKSKGKEYKPGWSDWADKEFAIKVPKAPVLSVEHSSDYENLSTFTWTTSTDNTAHEYFVDVEWQTILVKECKETDGSKLTWKSGKLGWATGTGSANGTVPTNKTTEDTTLLAGASYTRWVRVRSRGPAGASDWKYKKHPYAKTYQANVGNADASDNGSGGSDVVIDWTATSNEAHPIDGTTVQYAITVPASGMACPSGVTWTDASVSKDTSGTDKVRISVDDQPSLDEVMFVRVNTKHDTNITYGKATLVMKGYLKDPSGLSVQTDDTTHKATISATNNSDVPDSFLAVEYAASGDPSGSFVVGIIPHGSSSVTVQCPDWSDESAIAFGVRAVVGSYQAQTREDGADCYAVTEEMRSENTIWDGGAVPAAPGSVEASPTQTQGTIRVTWDWSWEDANGAEITWADHEDAWESTDEPSSYSISHLHAAAWNISGLETGKRWWIRVRLVSGSGDNATYGPWSDAVVVDLSSAPSVPVLALSPSTIAPDGSVVASWAYSTTDGTEQAYAEICEATVSSSGVTYGDVIAHTQTAQHMTINAEEVGWTAGTVHGLCVRVVSGSGRVSDEWSDPVFVAVAEPLSATITGTSLVSVPADEIMALQVLPLTVTVAGAGTSGETTVSIERAENYEMVRPDDSLSTGFAGEVVAEVTRTGDGQLSIGVEDLRGQLDDGAAYLIRATVRDGYGQSVEATPIRFEVRWSHQAIMPEAKVTVDQAERVAIISIKAPTGAATGDTCDIYRLSTDKPELIVEGASLGEVYVDPFPAIGENAGHRIVFRTKNGDYITEDKHVAWIDLGYDDYDVLECEYNIIDFKDEQILFEYNVDISHKWQKDFRRTKYLGGAVQGDWNAAVERDATVNTAILVKDDPETQKAMRRLAEYPGICHIRTKDGSSFTCDIQVKEDVKYSEGHKLAGYTLDLQRCDAEGFDGVTYEEWKG